MKKVIVVSGISGSGKSTYAHTLTANGGVILSADDYFTGYDTRPYSFDSTLLGKAHAMCFKLYVEQLQHALSEDRLVIVDNTNTTAVEIAPYMLAADAFGYLAEVHTLRCGSWNEVDMCLQRNRHEVPMAYRVRPTASAGCSGTPTLLDQHCGTSHPTREVRQ